MNCDYALEQILIADPDQLRGTTDDDLTAHLRECPRCQAAARRILAYQDALARGLETPLDPQRVDAAITAALRNANIDPGHPLTPTGSAATGAAAGEPIPLHGGRSSRWRRRSILPLALAASLAGLLLARTRMARPPATGDAAASLALLDELRPVRSVEVNAPRTGSVAILGTTDPHITVVWYLPNEARK